MWKISRSHPPRRESAWSVPKFRVTRFSSLQWGSGTFSARDWGCRRGLWYIVSAQSGFPRSLLRKEGAQRWARALGTPSPSLPPSPMEALLTWEAPLYGCPKCGKDMVAVPGPLPSSLASSRLSPAILRLQLRAASVPYAAAGAQRRLLRPLGTTGGRAEGSPAAEPCAPEGAPPARVVRKTEGPMDGQGKGEDMGCPRRAVAREGEARRGAVRLPRCPSPRWPEAQCDVTVIPGRQAGPRALGPRATKRAKRSQPVRARALSPTLTLVPGGLCSW